MNQIYYYKTLLLLSLVQKGYNLIT